MPLILCFLTLLTPIVLDHVPTHSLHASMGLEPGPYQDTCQQETGDGQGIAAAQASAAAAPPEDGWKAFVRGLPTDMEDQAVGQLFEPCGEIVSLRVPRNHETGVPRVWSPVAPCA